VKVPDALRFAAMDRDGFACAFCTAKSYDLRVDLVLPWSRGGAHVIDNAVTSCPTCSRGRGRSKRIAVPHGWMPSQDADHEGFRTWRTFGAWSLRFIPDAMALCLSSKSSHVYILSERAHESDWIEHYERKTWSTDEIIAGLHDGLDFLRSIVRPRAPLI